MRAFSRAVDRFCQKHRSFGIPRLMLYIVVISAAVFILISFNPAAIYSFLVFHPSLILQGQIWRLITWVFIPVNMGGGISGILFTAIALYFYYYIGITLEREWGAGKFTIYYLLGIALHIVYGFIAFFVFSDPIANMYIITINPMYINLSMFFAFAVLMPDVTIRLFLVIPIKIKWLAIANAGFFLYQVILLLVGGNLILALLPLVALINFILICGDELLSKLRPMMKQASPQVMNFRKEAKRAKRDLSNMPYRHKCAVCGKTDAENPELEFRYCSLCDGYHCFCSEHINRHEHIRQ